MTDYKIYVVSEGQPLVDENNKQDPQEKNKDFEHNPPTLENSIEEMLEYYMKDFTIEEGYALGYITDMAIFNKIVEFMKNKGFSYSIRGSDVRHKKKKLKKNSDEAGNEVEGIEDSSHTTIFYQLKVMPIKFFGLPFSVQNTIHYHCAHGCKYYKSRVGLNKKNMDQENGKRRRPTGSKKMGCLARMTLKGITVYPEYKLGNDSDWRTKKTLIESLRRDLLDQESIVIKCQRFYITVSLQSSHNHPPIIMTVKENENKKVRKRVAHKKNKKPSIPKEIPKSCSPNCSNDDWQNELASTSLPSDKEVDIQEAEILNVQEDNFFNTLVKFPSNQTNFEQTSFKPVEIELLGDLDNLQERTIHVQSFEYHPTHFELQLLFKEKLKKLYTLSESCTNIDLLLKSTEDLGRMELHFNSDIASYTTYE